MYNHIVIEKPLNNVVNIITVELKTPSCPIFLAMTKHETVVADPNMTRIAISCSLINPNITANGKKMIQNPNNFINVASKEVLISPKAD